MTAHATALRLNTMSFMDEVAAAEERVLLLDYDGTLAPFTADRKHALPWAPVPKLIEVLMTACRTRVVLITNRAAEEIPGLLRVNPHPEVWGSHGLERLSPAGIYDVGHISEQAKSTLQLAADACRHEGLEELLEEKPGALALHWRGLAARHVEDIRAAGYRLLGPLACRTNLVLTEFDGGLELHVRGCNKGHAVRCILAETDPETPVCYLGDDLADEHAFRALEGRGLTVLVRAEYRPTCAQTWLRPPGELVEFLNDWVDACGGAA